MNIKNLLETGMLQGRFDSRLIQQMDALTRPPLQAVSSGKYKGPSLDLNLDRWRLGSLGSYTIVVVGEQITFCISVPENSVFKPVPGTPGRPDASLNDWLPEYRAHGDWQHSESQLDPEVATCRAALPGSLAAEIQLHRPPHGPGARRGDVCQ